MNSNTQDDALKWNILLGHAFVDTLHNLSLIPSNVHDMRIKSCVICYVARQHIYIFN